MMFESYLVKDKLARLGDSKFTEIVPDPHKERIASPKRKYLNTDGLESKKPKNSDPVEMSNSLLGIKSAINLAGVKEARKEADRYDSGMTKKFQSMVRSLGGDVDRNTLKEIKDEAGDFLLKEKYKWNLPRPWQAAEILDIPFFERYKTDSSNSPSYPSGHSFQAHVLSEYLSLLFPQGRKHFKNLANSIANSRILGGLHFKEDIEEGKRLAEELARKNGINIKQE